MSIAYPASFPTANVIDLFGLIRSGTVYEHKDAAGKDVWMLQGYGQRVTLGEPGETLALATLSDDDRNHVEALRAEVVAVLADTGAVEASARDGRWLRLLLQNLPALLELLL